MLREDDPPPLPHLMQHSPYNARHTNTSPRYHNDDDDDADDNHDDGDCDVDQDDDSDKDKSVMGYFHIFYLFTIQAKTENKFLFFEAFSLNFPREKNIDKGFFFSFLVFFSIAGFLGFFYNFSSF